MRINVCGKYKYVGKEQNKSTLAHRNIMHTVDPKPNEADLVVHHIDGNKSNNEISNLIWMTQSEHRRLHMTGENHFKCHGAYNANYKHGMCVDGHSKEYKKYHNSKTYQKHHDERLKKQNAYESEHREHKRWYDKVRYWEHQLSLAEDDERIEECKQKIYELKENEI